MDDDEFYPTKEITDILDKVDKTDADACSVKFWFLTDKTHYSPGLGKRTVRFYRNNSIKWTEEFTKEYIPIKKVESLGNYYINLSYLKKYTWRNEFGGEKFKFPVFFKKSRELPDFVKEEIKWL